MFGTREYTCWFNIYFLITSAPLNYIAKQDSSQILLFIGLRTDRYGWIQIKHSYVGCGKRPSHFTYGVQNSVEKFIAFLTRVFV